ncbi:AraC family transcriptional regulator [Anaerocolumna sp. AGMB13020]|uniref:AraC family transcriptional regulator n=1 Tax=Anaerocolumna sp. AGMB13020 TaxID=3081750 RepID=UPI0029541BB1|nr:AraC family transcriptional regulator [Anaerocolumna sp. AGMB13020]WOO35061.1 AraC family transcriptional regulator [Anaerocolumna sp. AGMB13020]
MKIDTTDNLQNITTNKIQIITDPTQKELKEHGSYQFPVLVSEETLSKYTSGSFLWHWHKEIEFTLVLSGNMFYQINEDIFYLTEGEALFGNSNTLHTGRMDKNKDCNYLSVTFNPKIIYGYEGSLIQHKYVNPLQQDTSFSSFHFDLSENWHTEIISYLMQLSVITKQESYYRELDTQLLLLKLWRTFASNRPHQVKETKKFEEQNIKRIKQILTYLENHFTLKIELEDVARHINLCKSECCRLFKRYMGIPLFEYLIEYRIEKSLFYVTGSDISITEIALNVGFTDPNYYSKVFRKLKGCSPTKYRQEYQFLHMGFSPCETKYHLPSAPN